MSRNTLILLFLVIAGFTYSQSLPVGTAILDDYYRRSQLNADTLQPSSLMIRPIHDINQSNEKIVLKVLPLTWKQQFNSDHPEGINDGAMIPARGYQALLTGGVYAKYGIISLQLMPELVYAANKEFDGFPDELNNKVWSVYNSVKNKIDLPDKFGDEPYKKAFLGQSSLRLNYKSLSLGISNENLWWGPGYKNALLMTNNAPGFKHITFNTTKPIKTPIGKFEWQIIGGRLENSGYYGIDTTKLTLHGLKPKMKRDSWRYINAMTVNYQPKWLPGLSLGGVRSFTLYGNDINSSYRTYLPLFEPLYKNDVGGEVADTIASDQIASIYARYLMPESKAEIYLEYGRNDHSWDITDFALEPDHFRAYIFGFRKLITLNKSKSEFLDLNTEITQFGRNLSSSLRVKNSPASWYTHGQITHGHTHLGQILGSGIGTSSNMQSLSVSWVKDIKRVGLEFYRLAHDEDFWAYISQTTGYGDYRTHWVDLSGALFADWDYKNFLINLKFQTVGSINYMFYYDPIPSDPPFWWDKGKVRYNIHTELSVTYLFNNKIR